VKSKVLIEAQRESAWVLESLCVEVEWTQKLSTHALVMYIVEKPLGQSTTQHALGVASLDVEHGSRGAVFLSRIRSLEKLHKPMISLGTLLGYVLAHEIGICC
jgi:hypothetical protein